MKIALDLDNKQFILENLLTRYQHIKKRNKSVIRNTANQISLKSCRKICHHEISKNSVILGLMHWCVKELEFYLLIRFNKNNVLSTFWGKCVACKTFVIKELGHFMIECTCFEITQNNVNLDQIEAWQTRNPYSSPHQVAALFSTHFPH